MQDAFSLAPLGGIFSKKEAVFNSRIYEKECIQSNFLAVSKNLPVDYRPCTPAKWLSLALCFDSLLELRRNTLMISDTKL